MNFAFSSDFRNRSWVDIVDEEEKKKSKLQVVQSVDISVVKNQTNKIGDNSDDKAESSRRGRKNAPTKNAAPRFK